MNIKELRALQAPLKKRYKQNPESAIISARAEGLIEGEDVACQIHSHHGDIEAGLHPATGGDGSKACSASIRIAQMEKGPCHYF